MMRSNMHWVELASCLFVLLAGTGSLMAAYKPTQPQPLPAGAIEVKAPGACDQEGKTYVLTQDITSETSGLFLANNVTLDLNGHSITCAAGNYGHIPNYGFEEGLKDWDISKAPGAKIEDTDKVKPFIGKKILRLPLGQEVVSGYVTLPLADRSYYAMCGVLTMEMKVTVSVENERGEPVIVQTKLPTRTIQTCPVTGMPNMGGGFVYAYLHGLPAGKYRIRVKAESVREIKTEPIHDQECLIDEVDIRPAMDVGVGIVGQVYPNASYENAADGGGGGSSGGLAAFADYADPANLSKPRSPIPQVRGKGTITIRNGVVRNKDGYQGVKTWGLLSTAPEVKVVLENVKFVQSGIDAVAATVAKGQIKDCRFESDVPFVINRHTLMNTPVSITEASGSEISDCEFLGGQGNLNLVGKGILVHDNLFVNHETVTNHYSIGMANAYECKIYNNKFQPQLGSGILLFRSRNNEVYGNTFDISGCRPGCEYTKGFWTTAAIRVTDYNARRGAADGADSNKFHHNKLNITCQNYADYTNYFPIAAAFYITVGAGTNYVYDNEITVNNKDPQTKAQAWAFYIGACDAGAEIRNNKITTNVPVFWISTSYGPAGNVQAIDNTIIKSADAPADFKPVKLGFWNRPATNVEFIGNKFINCEFGVIDGVTEGSAKNEYTVK